VSTISSESALRCSRHHSTSRSTHADAEDSGDANKTKYRDRSSARSIVGHNSGVAAKLVVSRNTRNARRRYHRLPNDPSAACSAGARRPSAAWL